MPNSILTRMGDGERVSMPADEVKEEILLGTQDAAQDGDIPELTAEDLEQLFDIMAEPGRTVSVPHGAEVVVTDDGCAKLFCSGPADGGAGLPISRQNSILAYERAFAADTVSIGHEDYSFKPVKPIIDYEAQTYFATAQATTVPFFLWRPAQSWTLLSPRRPASEPGRSAAPGENRRSPGGPSGRGRTSH